jgi:hypothetical protein
MPASGKSTVSKELVGIFGSGAFNLDVICKQMMGSVSRDFSHTKLEKRVIRVAGKIGSTVEGVMMRENCPVIVVTDLDALMLWNENAVSNAEIGKENDRLIHVFSRKKIR